MKKILPISILLSMILLNACTSSFAPIRPEPAKLAAKTTVATELQSLPAAKEKIVAAVYKFRDQTGQYKQSSTGTSWSTAVTQGATSILMRALEESQWFVPIEREGLSNLLNERKIIRSSRANYKGANGEELPALPPLLYAGVILEGGIISYETNVITGGAGLKYFGSGGSNQYREDKITIYLRATSTQNGRVLKTVTTSKTILSQMVDIGIFKYVNLKELLEVETGFSYNEPVDMCVAEAIEKAVYSMVIEGIEENLWEPANKNEATKKAIDKYEEEKALALAYDYTEKLVNPRTGIEVGFEGGPLILQSDYGNERANGYGGLNVIVPINDQYKVALSMGLGKLSSQNFFHTNSFISTVKMQYDFAPFNHINPFVFAGVGYFSYQTQMEFGHRELFKNAIGLFNFGLGIELYPMPQFGVSVRAEDNIAFNDQMDGITNGRWNDSFWAIKVGLNYFLKW